MKKYRCMKTLPLLTAFALVTAMTFGADYTIHPEDRDLTAPLPDGIYHSPALPPPEGKPIRKYAEDEPGTGPSNFGVSVIHDNRLKYYFRADRAEYRWNNDNQEKAIWDVQGWIGGDYNKLSLESEGEWVRGEGVESAFLEVFYARSIATFWDLRFGLRQDFEPKPERTFGVLSLQGLAPYFFETEFNIYVDDEARVSFNLEVEFDIRLSQRLVLQPRLEVDAGVEDEPEYSLGSGVRKVEVGARLRYEISRKFTPYVGVSWETLVGDTADMSKDPGSVAVVAGVRLWF